jgi:hypothetical protein
VIAVSIVLIRLNEQDKRVWAERRGNVRPTKTDRTELLTWRALSIVCEKDHNVHCVNPTRSVDPCRSDQCEVSDAPVAGVDLLEIKGVIVANRSVTVWWIIAPIASA